ncbi:hypothetical protein [Methylobacterium sp. 275MFSha3.1]|uniref:hypothetical protein n=1 Tax=Methylobacterium sp. 275MFSha3.1 TaxID=1502746 RepID=UPI00111518DB|nr:hypothetical protein [Methylobacterium sp. 275MFSha3.1]
MSNSNSTRAHLGFKIRIHFARLEGERDLDIGNPIVAFEDECGNFSPRRPEPGETHAHAPAFISFEEANEFLLDREIKHVDHARLIQDEKEWGLSPYWEFVENPDALRSIQPALPSFGGFQELKAFHIWLNRDILEYRAHLLPYAEFRDALRDEFRMSPFRAGSPAEIEHGSPGLARITRRMLANRKTRWTQKRKQLPVGTPRYRMDAQLYLPWHDFDANGAPVVAVTDDEWA